jgi:hypothetical protein
MLLCTPFQMNLGQQVLVEDSRDPAADAEELAYWADASIFEVFLHVRKCFRNSSHELGMAVLHSKASWRPRREQGGVTTIGTQLTSSCERACALYTMAVDRAMLTAICHPCLELCSHLHCLLCIYIYIYTYINTNICMCI